MGVAGEEVCQSISAGIVGCRVMHSFPLAFVETGVIPSIIPRHHEILECFILDCDAVSDVRFRSVVNRFTASKGRKGHACCSCIVSQRVIQGWML